MRRGRARSSASVFVALIGDEARDCDRILPLVETGALVVLASDADTLRLWLRSTMAADDEHEGLSNSNLGGLRIDRGAHLVMWRDKPLRVSEREFRILSALGTLPGRARSFDELLAGGWGTSYRRDPDLVRSAVKRLRRKFRRWGVRVAIESVPGFGFRLSAALDGEVGGSRERSGKQRTRS